MQTFVIGVIAGVVKELLEDPNTRNQVVEIARKLFGGLIKQELLPTIPVAVAAGIDGAIRQIPGIENVKDVVKVAADAEQAVIAVADKMIPEFSTGIPWIDSLDDVWHPKR